MKRKKKRIDNRALGWHKTDSRVKRRRAALESRKGDYLKTAKALMQVANQNPDNETRRKARVDALYFFEKYRLNKRKK